MVLGLLLVLVFVFLADEFTVGRVGQQPSCFKRGNETVWECRGPYGHGPIVRVNDPDEFFESIGLTHSTRISSSSQTTPMKIEYKTADADVVEVLDASVGAPRIERAVRVTKALKNMKNKVHASGSDRFFESSTQSSTNAPSTTSELNTELFTEVPCQSDGEASPSSPSFPSSTFGRHPNRMFILLYLAVGIAAAVAVVCIAIQKKDKILACIHRKKSGDEEDSLEMENGSAKPTETV